MPAWVAFTLTAAVCQTWRTALQQRLRAVLSVNAAGLVRYLYALPIDVALLGTYWAATGEAAPRLGWAFLVWCALAGLCQVLGTSLLIMAFGYRGFAVGTAYAKTDGVQAALAGWLLFGQRLPGVAWVGIGVALAGVMVLSLAGRGMRPGELLWAAVQPGALCGLAAGGGFALSGLFVRAAVGTMVGTPRVFGALVVLLVVNLLQTGMQGGWMLWREPGGLVAAGREWRRAAWVGVLSGVGSAMWFSAFALAPVALVRTVGQADLGLVLLFGRFYLGERARVWEYAGLGLIGVGVVAILAG